MVSALVSTKHVLRAFLMQRKFALDVEKIYTRVLRIVKNNFSISYTILLLLGRCPYQKFMYGE